MIKHTSTLQFKGVLSDDNCTIIPDDGADLAENEVRFVIRLFSHGNRSRLRQRLAPFIVLVKEKSNLIQEVYEKANFPEPGQQQEGIIALDKDGKEVQANRFTPEQLHAISEIEDLQNEIDIVVAAQMDPVYIEEGLVSITGLEIDGKKEITPKLLYEKGPELLCKKIAKTIKEKGAGLDAGKKENLESPTTSGAVEDGQKSNMIAPPASRDNGIDPEIALSTSRTM